MKTNIEILAERARRLAVNANDTDDQSGKTYNVVEFLLTPERYSIDCQYIKEVLLLKELTPIPGAPAFVAGLTNVRGKIISIVDLKIFLGLVTKGITDLNKTIILSYEGMEFGIITDAILGTKIIRETSISAAPDTLQGKGATYVRGITPDGMIMLDGERLLSEKSLIVNQKQKI
ncbi:MAG: purine-binding chemotaxis protein CheW [Bacteroidales bacterium]|nr:purine-binding chemotaxis protein CheW [Bacteroidales bacterium]